MRAPKFIATLNQMPNTGRRVVAALLLAAVAFAIFAGSALAAGLLTNGSFETDTDLDGIPDSWDGNANLTSKDKRVCNQSYAGACSFKMVAQGTTKVLDYSSDLGSGTAGDKFKLKAWTKGKDIVNVGGQAQVWVQINLTGGGTSSVSINLPPGSSPWTSRKETVEASADYDTIFVYVYVNASSGKAWFDKVVLTQVAP